MSTVAGGLRGVLGLRQLLLKRVELTAIKKTLLKTRVLDFIPFGSLSVPGWHADISSVLVLHSQFVDFIEVLRSSLLQAEHHMTISI